MVDLSDAGIAAQPMITPAMAELSQYDIPLLFKPRPKHVLIVGAGSGNDVAGALRGGAERVTAVDIDPVIIDMGRRHHPERPYDSDRVIIVNDDARSFFASTKEKYDLIIFGLLDSHTMTSMTNARLDHYVYTKESIAQARKLLTDGGVISLNFMAHRNYIADRINRCLTEVFGRQPLTFVRPTDATGWGGVMFVTGDEHAIASSLNDNPTLAAAIAQWQQEIPLSLSGTTRVATDDWPYLYLERPRIPSIYLLMGGLMLTMLGYARYRCAGPAWFGKWNTSQWHFFFLGAAFLLLEVQNISKASVVLGNTWIVNAVIISGILTMVLLANFISAWARGSRWLSNYVVTCGLIGACVALYFIDLSSFGFLPFYIKAPLVGALTTVPMLFSGILFIDSFARTEDKGGALGANLIGSLIGGLLQAVTFVIGVKALLLVVAVLYAAALATRPKPSMGRSDSADLDEEASELTGENDATSDAEAVLVGTVG
jgi:spermidine synthase